MRTFFYLLEICFANNVVVIDSSILHNYKSQAASDILTEKCFSFTDVGPKRIPASDPFVDPNDYYHYYIFVSYCPNKSNFDNVIQQRSIATAINRKTGFKYYRHFLDDHMSDVRL